MDEGSRGALACLARVKPAYEEARAAGKAVGLGLGLKNTGLGNGAVEVARAVVRFDDAGGVEVRHCWSEMGQGIHTVARQVAVEELGVAPDRVRVVVDTSRELGAGQTTGSRGTLMGAGAIAAACRRANEDGRRVGVDYLGEHRVDWTDPASGGPPASRRSTPPSPTPPSSSSWTAESGRIDRVLAVHDVGRAVNPLACEGQIQGSVHMGLGYALSEDFPTDENARPRNLTLRSLGILRPKDVPRSTSCSSRSPSPRSPYGIKGIGEIGLVPTAGAVAAALHDLDGVWRATLPMSTPPAETADSGTD